ncbi:sporulation protein YpjB [Sediminibacillus halophilus]|uniref:Sporulation protein YpjB n=1 Tax=Sediminibacillus halophilus TaxID=482461 RepID=A0A1G9LYG8_9BACI|nr:sporulation protein YpjB [Sediminibacillus halophilus]SDL67049.1 sporulation protein YpjB [Sediminibacillus halophilus]
MNRTSYAHLFLCFLLGVGIFLPGKAVLAHHQDVHSSIYQYVRFVQEERYKEAETLLQHHSQEFSEYASEHADAEEANVVAAVLERNLQAVAIPKDKDSQLYTHAMALLLVFDALKNEQEPLWMTWKQELQNEIEHLSISNKELAMQDINRLKTHWNILEPALKLAADEEDYIQTSASIRYLLASMDSPRWQEQMITASDQLQQIEAGNDDKLKRSLTLIFMVAAVGGFIIITLSYVAWKKYKGERNKQENKRENS